MIKAAMSTESQRRRQQRTPITTQTPIPNEDKQRLWYTLEEGGERDNTNECEGGKKESRTTKRMKKEDTHRQWPDRGFIIIFRRHDPTSEGRGRERGKERMKSGVS